tara:strand:+ start:274 stop:456 length:183 start_codon:yes stop_codon:yes gene_type:complete
VLDILLVVVQEKHTPMVLALEERVAVVMLRLLAQPILAVGAVVVAMVGRTVQQRLVVREL